jgi:long-chain acyl-CoA synthetase
MGCGTGRKMSALPPQKQSSNPEVIQYTDESVFIEGKFGEIDPIRELDSSKKGIFGCFISKAPSSENESRILRSSKLKENEELISSPGANITTLLHIFERGHMLNKNNPLLGTRIRNKDGTLGKYTWKTWDQVFRMAVFLAKGISKLELCPLQVNPDGDGIDMKFLGIFSRNREEWIITDAACFYLAATVVTLYDTLGEDSTSFIIEQTQLLSIVLQASNVSTIIKMKESGKGNTLKNLIVLDNLDDALLQECKKYDLTVYSFEQVIDIGKNSRKAVLSKPTPETVISLCYTSGTTGEPKGVRVSHKQCVAVIAAINMDGVFETVNVGGCKDTYISYLPLAHMYERIVLWTTVFIGLKIGFYGGDMLKLKEDLAELKPTIMVSVPRLYNRFYDVIMGKVNAATGMKKKLLNRAFRVKLKNLRKNGCLKHKFYDKIVFKKMRMVMGGKMKLLISGAAPIAADVLETLKICFSCPISEGFGQTETAAPAFEAHPADWTSGHVGGPIMCVECKVVGVPEMNYLCTDKNEKGDLVPRGELCMRGPSVMVGYFKNREKTEEAIDQDGWLHSGDIVAIIPGGKVKIIDRIKNIFKLSQGEYVAVEKLENVYNKSPFVSQIFVYGDSFKSYLVSIIVPDPDCLKTWAKRKGTILS